jgi:hypothetical protein
MIAMSSYLALTVFVRSTAIWFAVAVRPRTAT